jgi:hypothetical protein
VTVNKKKKLMEKRKMMEGREIEFEIGLGGN